jgi:hypothetical protein
MLKDDWGDYLLADLLQLTEILMTASGIAGHWNFRFFSPV